MRAKIDDWCKSIDDDIIVKTIKENAIITGGALVSLLQNEQPNDYDVYFKTKESCFKVAQYYATRWNETHAGKNVEIRETDTRITAFIQSAGIVAEDGDNGIDDTSEPCSNVEEEITETEKQKYRPRYFSTNAISLSDKIQLVIRFCGSIDEIHTNYDFVHCTCSYDYKQNCVTLPQKALECIINKELCYAGSKYPLCSIIRTRKYITRGWKINAGQYLKMALQLNELNLLDMDVFFEQVTGVDSAYFNEAIQHIKNKKLSDPDFEIDNTYLFNIINRIF